HISPSGELPHTGFANERKPNFLQKVSRFIRGNVFLPDPRRGWNKYAFKEACKLIESEHIDAVVTTSPPHSTQLIGLKLKRKYPNIKWIADLRDPWTDIYFNKDLYQTSLAKRYNARLERKVLECADEIITVSGECLRNFKSKTNKALPIRVIENGYDEVDFETSNHRLRLRSDYGLRLNIQTSLSVFGLHHNSPHHRFTDSPIHRFTISYIGSLAPQYETDTFVNALKLLSPEIQSKIHLQFVGGTIPSKLQESLSTVNCQLSTVHYVPHSEAIEYMCSSDLLLLLLPNQVENKGIITGKLFEYMASGNPVLMIGYADGDAANILYKYENSGVFAFGESCNVAKFIEQSISIRPKVNVEVAKQYSRNALTARLAEMLK
ncbi:MAG: glycosyltransferase, partial [Paludibacteraceae bacterium]|nr:glycosyltransferase [Paludibacteraceae bacterium]